MSGSLPTIGNTIAVNLRIVKLARDVSALDQATLSVLNNPVATTDPTATDDITQGYQVSSQWLNQMTAAVWYCLDNTAGAAVWTQTNPSGAVTAILFAGNAVTAVPNPIVGGAGTVTIDITATLLGSLDLSSLPTSNPGGGQLWINGGGGSSGALWIGDP